MDDQFKLSNGWLAGINATHFKQDTPMAGCINLLNLNLITYSYNKYRKEEAISTRKSVCNKSRLISFIRNALNKQGL